MAMNKEAKHDKVAENTVEVCVRVLVKNADAEAVAKALNEAAEKMDGFVVNAGGYVEPAESHEIEEMLDSIPDEVAEAL
jgi:hypothetical protein